jgi:UDP-N-acetylmuramate dehydrogenase
MAKVVFNTFNLPVYATSYIEITSMEEALVASKEMNANYLFLGGGSNVLFINNPSGTVIFNRIQGIEILDECSENIVVKVGGGVNWSQWVDYAIQNDWGGLENLSLIPGTVGAAPIQNIGAYGAALEDVFCRLSGVHWTKHECMVFEKKDCHFGYRTSIFKKELKHLFFISDVVFKLTKPGYHQLKLDYPALQSFLKEKHITRPTICQVSDAVKEIRRSKLPDPAFVGNAGSFFKNPIISIEKFEQLKKDHESIPFYPEPSGEVKIPAAWLIEHVGWKGKSKGQVGTHPLQPLVIINKGGATGIEIFEFANQIQEVVYEKYRIHLEPEVNFVY